MGWLASFIVIVNNRAEQTGINTLWNLFKERLYSLFDKNVPAKPIKERRDIINHGRLVRSVKRSIAERGRSGAIAGIKQKPVRPPYRSRGFSTKFSLVKATRGISIPSTFIHVQLKKERVQQICEKLQQSGESIPALFRENSAVTSVLEKPNYFSEYF